MEEQMTSQMEKLSIEPKAFVEPGMDASTLNLTIKKFSAKECRITRATHPFQFYVVAYEYEKPYLKLIKRFRKEYAEMDENEIQEATPTPELLAQYVIVAVYHKCRWHRAAVGKQEPGESYLVSFLDTGDLEKIHISNIRRLYLKYLYQWPSLVIRCTFLPSPEAHFLIEDGYSSLFQQVASANPNCEATFLSLVELNEFVYWEVDLVVKNFATQPEDGQENDSVNMNYNLLTRLSTIHESRAAAESADTSSDLGDYLNYF